MKTIYLALLCFMTFGTFFDLNAQESTGNQFNITEEKNTQILCDKTYRIGALGEEP